MSSEEDEGAEATDEMKKEERGAVKFCYKSHVYGGAEKTMIGACLSLSEYLQFGWFKKNPICCPPINI
jgi:hypothetical protein